MAGARSLFTNLTPRGRLVLVASAVGILVLAFLMMRMAMQPSYSTLVSGLDPAETGKMTKALDEQGIAYELQNNGTALAVEKSKTAKARIALAEGGLTGSDKPGFELFDKQKLGASDFQQKVSYQRALEGEVARTVGQVDGVTGAQVQLTLPEDQLFTEESRPATAAVLISAGEGLDPSSVRGIASLVSSSVEGLKPSNVTITDQTGRLVWPNGDAGTGAVTAGTKQAAQARYERELEGSLNALLLRTVGPNKGQVQVQAELNTDEATQDKLEYARRGTPLRRRTEDEQLEGGGGGGAGGQAGANGNIPTYAQGAGGDSNYERESEETDFGVDKTVTRTKLAPGGVEQMDVALVLDKSVPTADVAALEQAVTSAAGIDEERGDTMAVSQIDFADVPEAKEPSALPGALGWVKYAALGLATLIFLVLVGRHLRRREDDELAGEPVWLRELDAPTTLAELEGDAFDSRGSARRPQRQSHATEVHREVEEIVEREPEKVAQQVRAWMNEA